MGSQTPESIRETGVPGRLFRLQAHGTTARGSVALTYTGCRGCFLNVTEPFYLLLCNEAWHRTPERTESVCDSGCPAVCAGVCVCRSLMFLPDGGHFRHPDVILFSLSDDDAAP